MELAIVENKTFANKTLTVSKDIEPSGKITLNKEGQVELPKAAADILCGIDGFKIVGGSGTDAATTQTKKSEEPEAEKAKYPEGDPTPKWTKDELVAWLKDHPEIQFEESESKAVLIGKIFKYLESAQQNGGQGAQGNGESTETKTE